MSLELCDLSDRRVEMRTAIPGHPSDVLGVGNWELGVDVERA
jgi:hypothetical protein